MLWTLAVPRDWVDLPSPSSHFQDSVSCLTCSHDSQLLRHPAIDIVWRWPCLPRFRLLQTPCYCGVLGGLSVLVGFLTYPSNRPTDECYDLPGLTHDLTVLQYSSWVLAVASNPIGELVLSVCHCFPLSFCLFYYAAHASIRVNGANRAMYVFR